MISALERVASGACDRLMLLLPPGAAKSTYASLVFPPWFLAQQPRASVIATSHTEGLAEGFGRGVRSLIAEHGRALGIGLDPTNRAATRFALVSGGDYFATGVRGPVTGRRADLLIIDDPVKSQSDADSAAHREHLWAWYRSDLVTRLRPFGRIVLVMTRWHPDDLGGRLIAGDDGWDVLRLPAFAEAGDLLGRAEGEALWPGWEDERALNRKRLLLGERSFAALYQQSPRTMGGRLFQIGKVGVAEETLLGRCVRAWDLAASDQRGDWTVGLKLCRAEDGRMQVADIVRLQGGPEMVVQVIRETAQADGRDVLIALPQDPGQAGKAQVSYLTRQLAGWPVVSSPESGSKKTRAMPVASQVNTGALTVLRGAWNGAFLEELEDFPAGAQDDQVDALSRAFGQVLEPVAAPARSRSLRFGER